MDKQEGTESMRKVSDKQMVEALRATHGEIGEAAARLGCHRHTISNRVKTSRAVREALEETREILLDKAETRLGEAIDRGEPWAIRYFLDNRGAARGYGRTPTVTVTGGVAVSPRLDESVGAEILERLQRNATAKE